MKNQRKKHEFEMNSKYLTISIYSIVVIFIGCVIFRLIFNWTKTIYAIGHFISVLSPFLIGLLIAYMMNPMIEYIYQKVFVKYLKRKDKRYSKILSVLFSYVIILGIFLLILNFVVPQMIASIVELSDMVPTMYEKLMDKITNFTKHGQNMSPPATINVFLNQSMPKLYNNLKMFMGKSIPLLYDISMQVIKLLINICISVIISIYLSLDKKILLSAMKRCIYAVFSPLTAKNTLATFHECNQIFSGYLVGKTLDSFIIGILCFIFMMIFKLPMAVLISMIVGITNMIPYFGPFIGAVPGVLLIGLMNPFQALKFVVLIFVLQQFDGYILGPRILGSSTGVRPVAILFSVIVGGAYFGVAGMFLGVPVFAVVQYLVSKWVDSRINRKNIDIKS